MLYTYEASDERGVIVKGEFEAVDKKLVVEHLERKNLIPIKIEEAFGEGKTRGGISAPLFETVTPLDRIILVRNLAATVKAGLSLLESLDILIADAAKRIMRKILTQAKANLENGLPLSSTFAALKKYFPIVFIGMMRAGEAGGRLDSVLEELSRHLTREYNLGKKIKSAMAYPFLLFVGSIGVIVLLLVFIIPRLAKTFKQTGVKLPAITQFLVDLSKLFTYSLWLDLLIVAAVVWFFIYFRKTETGRRFFIKLGLRIPIVKELIKKVALVRLTRTLGSLISSGTSIIEALTLSADAVGNEAYKTAVLVSLEKLKNGVPFSKTLGEYPELFPQFLTSLVIVGERTGTLEHILRTFADFYDDEIDHTLKDLTTFLEPALLLFMGLMIGVIALSILLPIYQLVGKFV